MILFFHIAFHLRQWKIPRKDSACKHVWDHLLGRLVIIFGKKSFPESQHPLSLSSNISASKNFKWLPVHYELLVKTALLADYSNRDKKRSDADEELATAFRKNPSVST